jgi:hypothetical protein
MPKAVQLHRQASAGTIKIQDILSGRVLTAKLESGKASGPQGAPELFLLLRLVAAETSGVAGRIHCPHANNFRPPNQSPLPSPLPAGRGEGILWSRDLAETVSAGSIIKLALMGLRAADEFLEAPSQRRRRSDVIAICQEMESAARPSLSAVGVECCPGEDSHPGGLEVKTVVTREARTKQVRR